MRDEETRKPPRRGWDWVSRRGPWRINWKGANGGQHYTGMRVKREKRVREGKQRGQGGGRKT